MNNRKGFTLIELLVVVLIIGILAAIALPQYKKAVQKAKITSLLSSVRSIKTIIDAHWLVHDSYPEITELASEINLNTANNTVFGGKYYYGFWKQGNPYHYSFALTYPTTADISINIHKKDDPHNRCRNSKNSPTCITCQVPASSNDTAKDICASLGSNPFTFDRWLYHTIL
ncbi:MAG: prepilin-type N-terminal cleavage/methylation domain-containing protein [Elusimicrobiota bacterium]|jgi:prepilin-type N-terminal cleavage/methylation domain-containing protein|nr:prepilin-type N-terminal cleavage/methylation domain-containing protein [Elusimicrobiota bacterium]